MLEETGIVSLRPDDTPEYMTGAWIGCVMFAANHNGIVSDFFAESRRDPNRYPAASAMTKGSPFDKRDVVAEFIKWVNANIWGPVDDARVP